MDLTGRPLRETDRDIALFVDRESELAAARTALENQSNVLVLGPRGIGKSSFLSVLARRLRKDDVPVIQLNGRAAASAAEFLALLREELRAYRSVPLREAASAVASAVGSFVASPTIVVAPPRSETRALQVELAELRANLPEMWTVALVDEMPSPDIAHALFGRLRDELWELPIGWAVAADERDRASYVAPPADAFWRRVIPLGALSVDDARALLRQRVGEGDAPDAVLDLIVGEADGNPRRLLALAYDLIVEKRDPHELVDDLRERNSRRERLSKPARKLLAELEAGGPASPSDEALLRKLAWSRSRASQVFRELEASGFVRAAEKPTASGRRPRRVYALDH